MNTITCKAQGLVRHLTTQTSMSGFEGPAAVTSPDDGFGNPMIKGRPTFSFDCCYTQKFYKNGVPYYDGEIEIPNTSYNRAKIAVLIRAGHIRVVDRNTEKEILTQNPKSRASRNAQAKFDSNNSDVPAGFEGRYVIARSGNVMVDSDPIVDPGDDAEFTEVKPEPKNEDSNEEEVETGHAANGDVQANIENAVVKKNTEEMRQEIVKAKKFPKAPKELPTADVAEPTDTEASASKE